jgi:2-polyprenyl-3-methyl-5-hydroxy-6-metoxy-1,4-benzoquinol methylase
VSRDRKHLEDAVKACYATWSSSYYADYYSERAAYPPVHREILRHLLVVEGARTVLDAGCGSASFLRNLAGMDMDLYGFDLTPQMVAEGRRVFSELGLPPERLWEGRVADPAAFSDPKGQMTGRFDAAICCGVFPHIPAEEDELVVRNLHNAVRSGGIVAVEARNALFALFTLNRYSSEFFLHELVRSEALAAKTSESERALLDKALQRLNERFRMDLPPSRCGKEGEPGYDEVLSRTHNPFKMQKLFETVGFGDVRVLFYHYHCLPPMLAAELPEFFRRESLAMEDPEDWRGHFMASAFIVTGIRK